MLIKFLAEKDMQKIKPLISTYRFNNYRAYRMLDKETLDKWLFNQASSILINNENRVIAAYKNKRIEPAGLVALSLLPWDTAHFGFKMAKICHLVADGNYEETVVLKRRLLHYLLKLCKNEKFSHITCRIDIDDISSIHALEENGFKLMDTLITYVFNRHKHRIYEIKELCRVRKFTGTDLPVLVKISKNAFHRDRFHLDPHIPDKKADCLFGEWVKNSCQGRYGDKVFVAERGNQVVGFLTFKLDEEINRLTGYRIAGHGLSAVAPRVKGIYPSLVKAAIKEIAVHYDCLEFDTQLNNYEVIKIWQRFGFDFARAQYTFHKWLRD